MKVLSNILVGIVATLHFSFLVLEMLPLFALIVQTKLASLGLSSEELITKLVANTLVVQKSQSSLIMRT